VGVSHEAPPIGAHEQAGIEDRISSFLSESDPDFKEDDSNPEDQDTDGPPQDAAPDEGDDEPEETLEAEDGDAGEEEDEEGDDGEPEEHPIETLSDLAQHWEMDEAELLNELKVKTGDGQLVPLSQLVQSYGQSGETPESKAFLEKIEAERAQEKQTVSAQVEALRRATDNLLTQLEGEEKLTDEQWKELEQTDPVEWNRRKIKEQEQAAALRESIRQMEVLQAEEQRKWEGERDKIYAQEVSSLKAKSGKYGLPDWNKADDGKAAMELIQSQMTDESIGFSQEEIMAVEDHRFLQVAYYAAKYLEMQKKGQKKVSRVRDSKLPKFSKATARRDTGRDRATKERQALRRRLDKTGSERDAARLIEDLL